jgi:hypothetical protein
MSEIKRSLVKPSAQTPFHIDFDWWQQNDNDWRVFLRNLLCAQHQEAFKDIQDDQSIDYVDPETAEVRPLDGIQHTLMAHCAQQEEFLSDHTAVVDAVFRIFLVNGNRPMTPQELGERLNRPADTILRTISGARVYKGLRPYYG